MTGTTLTQGPRVAGPALRRRNFQRDGYRCRVCVRRFGPDRLTADHIIPYSLGGSTVEGNLQTLCRRCNGRKSSKVGWEELPPRERRRRSWFRRGRKLPTRPLVYRS